MIGLLDSLVDLLWWQHQMPMIMFVTSLFSPGLQDQSPICKPCCQDQMPFQYNIWLMALNSWGHQATFPHLNFPTMLFHISPCCNYNLSILSNSSFSCQIKHPHNAAWCSHWTRYEIECACNCDQSRSLYVFIMCGSTHLSHLASHFTGPCGSGGQNIAKGTSTQSAWWSLGMPLPNAK